MQLWLLFEEASDTYHTYIKKRNKSALMPAPNDTDQNSLKHVSLSFILWTVCIEEYKHS